MIRLEHGHTSNFAWVYIGPHTYYFSYNTCVAYAGPPGVPVAACPECGALAADGTPPDCKCEMGSVRRHGEVRIRRTSDYSRTTAKHMHYFDVRDWPRVDDATFERIATIPERRA